MNYVTEYKKYIRQITDKYLSLLKSNDDHDSEIKKGNINNLKYNIAIDPINDRIKKNNG